MSVEEGWATIACSEGKGEEVSYSYRNFILNYKMDYFENPVEFL